jgi:hypothetical protein
MRRPAPPRGTLARVTSERAPRTAVAVALDGVCLVAFVLLGRGSHGLNGGSGWFLTVLWPFVLGWYAATFVTGLYRDVTHPWRRAVANVAVGVTLACVLRIAATSRSTPVVFGVVAFTFLVVTTLGWRAVARLAARVRVRASV